MSRIRADSPCSFTDARDPTAVLSAIILVVKVRNSLTLKPDENGNHFPTWE